MMLRSVFRGSLSAPALGPVRASARWRCCYRAGRHAAGASAGTALDLGGARHRRSQHLACGRAVSGPRRHRARLPPLPAERPATGARAIVVHGSSGSSGGTIHALSRALAARGVETYAVDIRGHGASGTRGDIGYVGQLEDDLADFVARDPQDRADGAADADRPFRPAAALRCAWPARRSRTCSRAPCCSRPISATTRRPTGRVPAAGPAPTFRASSA